MTYAEIKRKVLELINQYSIAGEVISPAYNNQSDYISRIPGLINDAVLRIRTEVKLIEGSCALTGGVKQGSMRRYGLPGECRRIKTGGVYRIVGGDWQPTANYRLLGNYGILLPDDGAEYEVEYYCRTPECLPNDPFDAYDIDEEPEILTAACYYAAAMLILNDNEFEYAALYNEYQRRVDGMASQPTAEISPILDVYGF
ncbi:MAG: hypothetical protein IJQ81_11120 [Oscillibacter sp.]|nr:hypothetical protein [Oscillibacter sp.]